MTWCGNYLKERITLENIPEIVQSLISKQNECPLELRDKVLDWIMDNYFKIYHEQNQSLRLCEEFLAKNVELTLSRNEKNNYIFLKVLLKEHKKVYTLFLFLPKVQGEMAKNNQEDL